MAMDKLRVDGWLSAFSRNKKGITMLTIKTDKLVQRDLDKLGQAETAPSVIIEFEFPYTQMKCESCGQEFDEKIHKCGWNAVRCPWCGMIQMPESMK